MPERRLAIVDLARGAAIAQMIAYHLCYDLNHFAWIHVAMTRDWGWMLWRASIVSQFLFLAGVSMALRPVMAREATGQGAAAFAARLGLNADFWRRWAQIVACAALVSLASWNLFGPRFIWFGVLHFVAVSQLLLAPVRRNGYASLLLGLLIVSAGSTLQFAAFAPNSLSWIGFAPVKPRTEDFVPLFPWLGAVLFGIGVASLWLGSDSALGRRLRTYGEGPLRLLAICGRWPLTVYMLHQPVLFGLLTGLQALRGAAAQYS